MRNPINKDSGPADWSFRDQSRSGFQLSPTHLDLPQIMIPKLGTCKRFSVYEERYNPVAVLLRMGGVEYLVKNANQGFGL